MTEVGNLRVNLGLDSAQFDRSITSLNRQLQTVGQEFRTLQNKGKDWGNSLEGLRSKQTKLTEMFTVQQEKVNRLSAAYEKAKAEQGEYSAEAQKLGLQLARAQAEMQKTETELGQVTSELERQEAALVDNRSSWQKFQEAASQAATQVGEKMKVVGEKMTAVGKDLSMKLTAPIVAFGVAAAKVGSGFEAAMSEVAAISGATGEDLAALETKAREMGATTKYSASEAADALKYMSLAGWNSEKSIAAIGGVLNLAAASGMDLAAASDLVTDYMSAFGIEAEKSGYFADVMAYAQKNANTSVVQLGDAFKNTAAVMNAGGQDVETTTAFLAMMANQGFKGAEAGTALTAIMRDMTAKMKDGAVQIGKTSIKVMDAQGNYRDLTDILKDVSVATDGMGDAERAMALSSTFTADSIKGLNLILNAGVDEAAKFEEGLRGSAGTAEKMAAVMNDNLQGRIKEMQSALEDVGITIYKNLQPALEAVVKFISDLAGWFGQLSPASQNMVMALTAIAAAVGPVLIVLGTLVASLGAVMTGLGAVSLPIVAVVSGIALLGAALVAAYVHFDGFKEKVDSVFLAVKEIATTVLTTVVSFVKGQLSQLAAFWNENGTQILQAVTNAFNGIKAVIDFIMPAIKLVVETVWTAIKQVITGALDVIAGAVKIFSGLFTGDFEKMWEGVKQLFFGAIDVILGWMTLSFFGGIKTLITNFAKSAIALFKGMWDDIAKTFSGMGTKVNEIVNKMVSSIINFFKDMYTNASKTFSTLKSFGESTFNALRQSVVTTVTNMVNAVKTQFTNKVSAVKTAMTNVKTTIQNLWNEIITWTTSKISGFVQIGKDIINGLIKGISEMSAKAVESITGVVDGIVNKAKKMLKIASPSKVFREIGLWTGEGLAIGIDGSSAMVNKSMENIADGIMSVSEKFQKEYSNLIDDFNNKNENKEDKSLEKIQKIRDAAAKKKRALTQSELQKIAVLEAEYRDGKYKAERDFDKKYLALVKQSEKEYLEVIKTTIEEKKSLDQLSLLDEVEIWERSVELFNEGSKERLTAQKAYKTAVEAVNKELTAINKEYSDQIVKVNEDLIKSEETLNKAYDDAVSKRASSLVNFKGIFDEFKFEIGATGEELMSNLQSQVSAFEEWQRQIDMLSDKAINKGLLAELKEMGPNALPQLIQLNSMTDKQLTEYSNLYEKKSKLAREQAEKELKGMKDDTEKQIKAMQLTARTQLSVLNSEWAEKIRGLTKTTGDELSSLEKVGRDAGNGLLRGLTSTEGALQAKARQIADSISQTIKSALQIKSPSRVMMGFGENVGEGLIIGMDDKIKQIVNAGKRMASAVTQPMDDISIGRMTGVSSSSIDNSRSYRNGDTHIYVTGNNPSPSEIARRYTQAQRQQAMEWGVV